MMMDKKYYEILDKAESTYVSRRDIVRELLDEIYTLKVELRRLNHVIDSKGRDE